MPFHCLEGRLPARTDPIRIGRGSAGYPPVPVRSGQWPGGPNVGTFGRGARHHNDMAVIFVYILRSACDGSEYVGMSKHPYIRLSEHNNGRARSTRYKRPWKLVHREECANKVAARTREKYLKSAAGRRFRKSLRAISSALRRAQDFAIYCHWIFLSLFFSRAISSAG